MHLDLDKNDLISLVKGSQPNFSVMIHPSVQKYGNESPYRGWEWDNHRLKECNEDELLNIYTICKNSWNN